MEEAFPDLRKTEKGGNGRSVVSIKNSAWIICIRPAVFCRCSGGNGGKTRPVLVLQTILTMEGGVMFFNSKNKKRTERFFALSSAFNGILAVGFGIFLLFITGGREHYTIAALLAEYGIDPARFTPPSLMKFLPAIEDIHPFIIAVAAFFYAIIRGVETYGLWRETRWGETVCALSAIIYLPFEIESIAKSADWLNISSLVFNVIVIVFMALLLIKGKAGKQ